MNSPGFSSTLYIISTISISERFSHFSVQMIKLPWLDNDYFKIHAHIDIHMIFGSLVLFYLLQRSRLYPLFP